MIDKLALMDALAEVESQAGRNNYPRFEKSYAPKGERWTVQGRIITGTGTNFNIIVADRWRQYGMASACSFSRWQILYHTAADLGYRGLPWTLWDDRLAGLYVKERLDVIAGRGATTVGQFADAWNSGNHRDGIVPREYIAKVEQFYAAAIGRFHA